MKTTILVLATLLTLNASVIFANKPGNGSMKDELMKIELFIDMAKLSPATPLQAEFSDGVEHVTIPEAMVMQLAPTTPKEAEFEDFNTIVPIAIDKLAPATPKESAFEEMNFENPVNPASIAPTTPAEADFVI
jgi:hypothetical protein